MSETDTLFSQGKLQHFQGTSRTIDGVNRTIHVTTGRMSNSALKAISGQEELPIISSNTKLAHMIVLSAHTIGGHKMASNTLARTRPIAYIHRSDSINTFTPNHLLMRRKLSPITPTAGGTFTLGFSLHQRDLYKIFWSRWRSEVLKNLYSRFKME